MKNVKSNKKKSLAIATIIILISMVFIPLGTAEFEETSIKEIESISGKGSFASHHMVLAEFSTTTTCPYCVSHKNYLPQVSGDFTYVALVANMNSAASQRASELQVSGVPDTWFDGHGVRVYGGQSSVTPFQNAYNACQARTVADVDLSLFGTWNEATSTINTLLYIDNTGSSTYNGHLHVYVTEETSRWNGNDGQPYHNALIGYAINKDITVGAGDTLIESSSGFSFPSMNKNNILLIATVYSPQGNSYLMKVDETDTAILSSGGDDDDDDNDDDYQPPVVIPKTKITQPGIGDTINGTVIISGTSHHPEGDQKIKWTLVKIDDGGWIETDDTIYWSLEWNTETVEDGPHTISAVCSDGIKQSAVVQATVEVKNEEDVPDPEKIPDLTGEGTIGWTGIKPKLVIQGEFTIENVGDAESELDWEIGGTPDWGDWTFTPNEGYDLTPEEGEITVNVLLVAPDEKNQEFTGEIKVVNSDDGSDYITVPVSLTTSKNKVFELLPLILQFLDEHPRILPILKIILGL